MTTVLPDGGLLVWPLRGIPEIETGDDLVGFIADAADGALVDGDVIAISSKIVSKAEGRVRHAKDREQAISDETVRAVASRPHARGVTRIVENRLGLVMAAAGVDSSNTSDGTVLLLPQDPDASARLVCAGLRTLLGVQIGVVITDTFGRPWRKAQTDLAIGAAGLSVVDDYRGGLDTHGRQLDVAVTAVVDEIASAADLVKGKTQNMPVAVVRGLGKYISGLDTPGAASLIRPAEEDMFSQGTVEAERRGFRRGMLEAVTFRSGSA